MAEYSDEDAARVFNQPMEGEDGVHKWLERFAEQQRSDVARAVAALQGHGQD